MPFAGALHALLGGPGGLTAHGSQFLHQATPGVTDRPEPEDRFGSVLTGGSRLET